MTYAPDSIKEAQVYLKGITGLPWASLGIVADGHGDSYHRGKGYVGNGSYSVHESRRDEAGLSGAASAFDIGGFSATYQGRAVSLRSLSLWLVEQCRAGAPDTKDIRSIIYTPDGKVVRRWDRLGVRSSGDNSHLTHTHISWFRDSEHRDKVGLFRRYFEGDDMSWTDKLGTQQWAQDAGLYDGIAEKGAGLTAGWHQENTNAHVRALRQNDVPRIVAAQEAIMAKLDGNDDGATRLIVAEELAKAAAVERAERAAELAPLHALMEAHSSGNLDAEEVVRRIGALLSAVAPPQD